MGIRILIPAKSKVGKTRLASVLGERGREQLCLEFLARTLSMAVPMADTIVAAQDENVAEVARQHNATVCVEPEGAGLNGALEVARASVPPGDGILVCPIDLPMITSKTLCRMWDEPTSMSIVPDRHGLGTNLLWLPPQAAAGFEFKFGSDSFSTHCTQAKRLGVVLLTPSIPEAQFDIDLPEDLEVWLKSRVFRCSDRGPNR